MKNGKSDRAMDIFPRTPVASPRRDFTEEEMRITFEVADVAPVVGMAESYILRALSSRDRCISVRQILQLIDLDAFSETFVPRSRVVEYLLSTTEEKDLALSVPQFEPNPRHWSLVLGSATDLIPHLDPCSIQCVVTSTPYWGMRIYEESFAVHWADGEVCSFGHEQTPEAFIRHTVEILHALKPAMNPEGSIWWNIMDTYNTRTQIRGNAAETLRAMQGKDSKSWGDHAARRYSAGHSFLLDGEQSLIPQRIAERASRIGYLVKSMITWKKSSSMPETVTTRVGREIEYVIHLSLQRSPYFDKSIYRSLPPALGGRNSIGEAEKLTDVWTLPTSAGQGGHGAQFPMQLPARCIALSTQPGDLVLDPFVGSGTAMLAAQRLNRRSIGFDVSQIYLDLSEKRLSKRSDDIATSVNGEPSHPVTRQFVLELD